MAGTTMASEYNLTALTDIAKCCEWIWKRGYSFDDSVPEDFKLLENELARLSSSLTLLVDEVQQPNSVVNLSGSNRARMVQRSASNIGEILIELLSYARSHKLLTAQDGSSQCLISWDYWQIHSLAYMPFMLKHRLAYHHSVMQLLLSSADKSLLQDIQEHQTLMETNVKAVISQVLQTTIAHKIKDISIWRDNFSRIFYTEEHEEGEESWQSWQKIGLATWLHAGQWWLAQVELFNEKNDTNDTPNTDDAELMRGWLSIMKSAWIFLGILSECPLQLYSARNSDQLAIQNYANALRSDLDHYIRVGKLPRVGQGSPLEESLLVWPEPEYNDYRTPVSTSDNENLDSVVNNTYVQPKYRAIVWAYFDDDKDMTEHLVALYGTNGASHPDTLVLWNQNGIGVIAHELRASNTDVTLRLSDNVDQSYYIHLTLNGVSTIYIAHEAPMVLFKTIAWLGIAMFRMESNLEPNVTFFEFLVTFLFHHILYRGHRAWCHALYLHGEDNFSHDMENRVMNRLRQSCVLPEEGHEISIAMRPTMEKETWLRTTTLYAELHWKRRFEKCDWSICASWACLVSIEEEESLGDLMLYALWDQQWPLVDAIWVEAKEFCHLYRCDDHQGTCLVKVVKNAWTLYARDLFRPNSTALKMLNNGLGDIEAQNLKIATDWRGTPEAVHALIQHVDCTGNNVKKHGYTNILSFYSLDLANEANLSSAIEHKTGSFIHSGWGNQDLRVRCHQWINQLFTQYYFPGYSSSLLCDFCRDFSRRVPISFMRLHLKSIGSSTLEKRVCERYERKSGHDEATLAARSLSEQFPEHGFENGGQLTCCALLDRVRKEIRSV